MAKQDRKITLTLDFDVERSKLQTIGNSLGKELSKGLQGDKANQYFNSAKESAVAFQKTVNEIYSSLSKPLVSKTQAKELATNLSMAFKSFDTKLLSLQGNIGKTFGSIDNAAALKKIRELGDEIDNLRDGYQAYSNLFTKSKSLGNKNELTKQLKEASKEYEVLANKQAALTTEEVTRQKELKTQIDSINKSLEEKARLQEQMGNIHSGLGVGSQQELSGVISEKIDEQQGLINGSISIEDAEKLKNVLTEIRKIISDILAQSNATGPKIEENIADIEEEYRLAQEQAKTFKSVMRELGIPMLSLQELASGFKQVIRYSYEYIKNLDAALTEISVVSEKSRKEVMALTDTFIELSAKTGMAIDDIAKASTIFYQQGLNDQAVEKLTEWTALFAKISGEDVPTAADQITAAINGFGYSYENVEEVVDKMSVLAAHSAADIGELATAMSKAASQANQAGLSFDQYNAYLATMIEATREAPENIGTSMKTIMSRMQQIKTGENTEDGVDVNQVEKALRSVNVSLRDTEGQLKDLDEVLGELGPKWNTLDRNTQAYLGTMIAGTRQQSRFITLMQNWDRVLELTTDSEKSAGAASKMHAAAMEGLDASINNLTNAWQKLISNLANGDSFKWLIDALTGLVKWLGEGNTIMKVLTAAIVIWDVKTVAANLHAVQLGGTMKNLDTAVKSLKGQFVKLGTNIKVLGDIQSKENIKIQEQTALVRQQEQAYKDLQNAKTGAATATPNVATTGNGDIPSTTPDAPEVPVNVKADVEDLVEGTDKVNKSLRGTGWSLKTFGKNITSLMGGIQTGITVAVVAYNAIKWIEDAITTTADEIREKAQEAYDETQKEIDKRVELINSVENNLDVYDKLSKKLNKSSEEVEQLANAANELAKAAPGALVGYDENGNPIIDPAKAAAEKAKAEGELVEEAKTQIANIGNLARADLKEQAEKNWNSSSAGKGWNAAQTAGTVGVAGGLATAAGAALIAPEPVVTKIAAVALGIAALGAAIWGVATGAEQAGISQEEYNLALEKAAKINDENRAALLENMSYITNNAIKNSTVSGVSESDRTTIASYIGSNWLNQETGDLLNQLATGEIDEEEYEKQFKALGQKWEDVLKEVDDRALAVAYKNINEVAENIGEKSYNEVAAAIKDVVTNKMGISEDDPLFKVLYDSFLQAAYSGTEDGVYGVIEDLKSRKATFDAAGASTESAKYDTAIKNAGNMSNNELSFYSSTGITENVDLFNDMVAQYGPTIREALVQSTEAAAVESIAILAEYRDEATAKLNELAQQTGHTSYEEIDYDSLTEKQQYYYNYWIAIAQDSAASIEDAWTKLAYSSEKTWSQLWDTYEKITDRAKTAWETWHQVASGEGIDYSQWKDFTTILDDIDFSAFSTDQLDDYAQALDGITESLKVENGMIYMNGKALEDLAELEQALAVAEIQRERTTLNNKKLELEANKAIIDAQIATLQYQIAAAKGSAEAENLKIQAQEAWSVASNKMNTFFVKNNGKVTEAIVAQFSNAFTEIASKFNQLQTAMADGKITGDEIGNLQKEWKNLQQNLTFENYEAETSKLPLADLENQLTAAQHLSEQYSVQISNIDLKLKTLGAGMNYTKEGVVGNKGDQEKINQYIGKLEEIFNIMNKIEREQSRLNDLDSFNGVAHGKDYIKYLQQRIGLTETLRKDYEQLIAEQKNMVISEQKAIKNSPVGDVFSFDQYGAIVIDYDKYLALQDEEIDGKKSLKELADNLYDEYEEYYDTLKDNYSEYIKYLEQEIELEQEKVDTYVDLQHDIADAVKDIYEEMLNEKLDAIDREMEALDELQEAYEESNKARDDSREMSKLQTDLRRSMMDTSGASNTKQLSYQDQIQSKLEEMGEDEYTKRLDDIRTALENQQDLLQKEFDEYFKNYEKLYNMIDQRIMNNENAVLDVLSTTDAFKTANSAERAQMIDKWKTDYHTAMDGLGDGGSIMDVVQHISDLKDTVGQLDTTIATQVNGDYIGEGVSRALTEWLNNQQEKENGGSGSGSGGGGSYGGVGPIEDVPMEEVSTDGGGFSFDASQLSEVSNWWSNVKDSIGSWWDGLVNGVKTFFTQTLPGFISTIPEKLGELAANVVNFLVVTLPDAIIKFVTVTIPNAVTTVATAIGNFFTVTLPTWFENAKNAVITFFTQTIPTFFTETLPQAFMDALAAIGNFFVSLKDAIAQKIGEIVDGIKNIFGRFWTSFTSNLSEEAKARLQAIGDWISEKWQALKDGIGAAKDWIVEKVTGLIDGIKEKFAEIGEKFKETWDNLKQGAVDAWNGIKETFANIPNWFKEKFSAAWQKVVEIFSSGGQMFANIKDGIVNAVKGVINKLRDGFNWVIKQPFNWLNGILNTIRNIEFLGISPFKGLWKENPIGVPQIPAFKTGGIADFTGPAWLDGTKSEPEAVLNAAQTKAFMRIADNLDKLEGITNVSGGNAAINIENISFQVESMSSPEDGEAAFDAFITKFKEIGSQSGLNVWQTRKA